MAESVGGSVEVGGSVAPGFEQVRDAFAENFELRGEIGAAFAATLDGLPVVDLWGGVADSAANRPWQQDTLQIIFSGTKGLAALCVTMLIDRGLLKLEDPVCSHWPEFAAGGKQAITVAEIVSHRGRLPGLRTPVDEQDVLDPEKMVALLAGQAQESDPRAQVVYHPLTYGWLCGELVRRVDGRSIGRFFAEEVAGPLGLEVWIGLPADIEERVAMLQYGPNWGQSPSARPNAFQGDDLGAAIWENPSLFPPGEPSFWNTRPLHATEMPGANGIGAARSIARLYGALACGGELDDVRIVSEEALTLARTQLSHGTDPFMGDQLAFGVGFMVQSEDAPLGPAKVAFGHNGAGGSCHGAWPDERVGFSYAMNEMRDDLDGDGRVSALLEALHACVGEARKSRAV
ncbi:MAG TPA: serine hydrolase domain-containing protein [Solirubrobacteraceae bacterium]|jgi:CubicO group peptidase (beta-lactamase class C family)|nr:serine hydrolase domain-containing protein [Solirubrobacteraceae bacterium]